MPQPSDYVLSEAENAAIFEQQIRPIELGVPQSVAHQPRDAAAAAAAAAGRRPVCILLAGQTGAGKSHAAPAFVRALARADPLGQPPVHLVADTHKPYHPAYAALLADAAAGRCPPGLPSAATGPDARRWLARACAAAAAPAPATESSNPSRRAVLVESASRFPADVAALAGVFRRGGFRVCVVLVAAHAVQSRLGLLARFLEGAGAGAAAPAPATTEDETPTTTKPQLPVRLTPRPIHDESYAGLARLAAWLDGTDTPGGGGDQLPPLRPINNGDDNDAPPPPPLPPVDAVLVLRRGNRVALARFWDAGAQASTGGGEGEASADSPHVARALDAERRRRQPAERAQFDADVARLREQHPDQAGALDALAAEYAAADEAAGDAVDAADLPELDVDALVARLQADDW